MFSNEEYLAQLLVEAGYLTDEQVQQARTNSSASQTILEYLLKQDVITQETIAEILARESAIPLIDLDSVTLTPEILGMLSEDLAARYHAVPISDDGFTLGVAISDPLNFEILDSLPSLLHRNVDFYCATHASIQKTLKLFYGVTEAAKSQGDEFAVEGAEGTDAPIIRLVYNMLTEAMRLRASDIHIEPLETSMRVRYRMDGRLVEVENHPKKLLPSVIARLKVMSGTMSIAEKRLPQDGRIQIRLQDRQIDLRVSSVPSNHGESIVMRILDKTSLLLGLPELGFFSDDQAVFEKFIGLPDGILLVTGPTGSGKTTTLYACLNVINKPDKKIITVEDPVEYELAGINQVMVKADVGMTFGAALRAMLRQAPNIIMIGEIRDAETANIAINAALTGHLVLSTLHTNDAPSAVARLADIGIKRFLIASAVRAVMAQRLVRKLCPVCKTPASLSEKEVRGLNLDSSRMSESTIFAPQGCEKCRQNGFKGRMGLFEIFEIDDEVRHMVNANFTTGQLRRRARELGMRSLREDGVRKVLAGLTSAQEVLHATMSDSH